MLIRIGDEVVNLDNVLCIDLNWQDDGERKVVFEFVMRGFDEPIEGQNVSSPYLKTFSGEAAEALCRYFRETCPDLLLTPIE